LCSGQNMIWQRLAAGSPPAAIEPERISATLRNEVME
jgi:hypothetical protein